MAEKKKKSELTIEKLLSEKDPKKAIEGVKFEGGVSLLDELVSQVEGGELDLENSIVSYERGMMVLEHLRGLLEGAEEKLKLVQEKS